MIFRRPAASSGILRGLGKSDPRRFQGAWGKSCLVERVCAYEEAAESGLVVFKSQSVGVQYSGKYLLRVFYMCIYSYIDT